MQVEIRTDPPPHPHTPHTCESLHPHTPSYLWIQPAKTMEDEGHASSPISSTYPNFWPGPADQLQVELLEWHTDKPY